MQENFMHFVWQYGLFDHKDLITSSGQSVRIQFQGTYNKHAGPDFFASKILIDDTLWVGNVEIHCKSSEWNKHGHSEDAAYRNVILHVVFEDDDPVYRTDGNPIPAVALKGRIHKGLQENYEVLTENLNWIPCEKQIPEVDSILISSWLLRMSVERLQEKTELILKKLSINNLHWEQTLYESLARSFGFHVNAEPFEELARITPQSLIGKHKDQLFQVEALLFGQSGLLHRNLKDEYPKALRREYLFLRRKYGLNPMEAHQWKFMRLRPRNFPTIRIAQFASLIHRTGHFFSTIIDHPEPGMLRDLFRLSPSAYWNTHYIFDKEVPFAEKALGENSIDTILINTVSLFLFLYGENKDQPEFVTRSVELLEEIHPETNSLVKRFGELGLKAESALQTQGLIHLKSNYCDQKKCLECAIGTSIIRN